MFFLSHFHLFHHLNTSGDLSSSHLLEQCSKYSAAAADNQMFISSRIKCMTFAVKCPANIYCISNRLNLVHT